jgi:hypothetical protein
MPALLLALAGLVGAAGSVEADVNPVRHRIEVETGAGKVLVHLAIENHGERTIWVPREVAEEEELIGRRFDLVEVAGGKKVDYVGPMVKRGAYTAEDYLAVKPNTVHLNTIDISRAYAFAKDQRAYEIRYAGPYLPDIGRLDAIEHSPSAPVRFSYTAR